MIDLRSIPSPVVPPSVAFDLRSIRSYKASKISWWLMCEQSICGIKFDKELAESLLVRIGNEMREIADEIEPQLPPRKLKKAEESDYTFPAKPFKKDGTLSVHGQRFLERHGLELIGVDHVEWPKGSKLLVRIEGERQLEATAPMTLGNSDDIKEYFLSLGWTPTLYNFQKGPNNKPIRDKETGDYIKTSPKLHERGKLCPNLELVEGSDLVKPILMWLKLRNRGAVLRGWLEHPRLQRDGRLPSASTGWTSTFREKHTVVCNVPKAKDEVVLGKEFRSLFRAEKGKVLVGWDASGLEDRIKGHYTYQFDGGDYATKILDPSYDVHQEAADAWGIPRHVAKNGVYALAYNAGPKKLAETIKCSLAEAEEYHRRYWDINGALRQLDERVTRWWEINGNKKWARTLDGRLFPTRSKHSLVNNLIQSTGSVLFQWALAWLHYKLGGFVEIGGEQWYRYNGYLARRVIFYHDEAGFECDPEIAEDVAKLGEQSIKWVGKKFKLNVPLESEAKIGMTWADLK